MPNYDRNFNVSYCVRKLDVINKIIIHHTASFPTASPEVINQWHIQSGTRHMVSYHYLIQGGYASNQNSEATLPIKIYQGRPLNMVGAHAGSKSYVDPTSEQKKTLKNNPLMCYLNKKKVQDNSMFKNNKVKTNVTSIGIAIIGNYAPFSQRNPSGGDNMVDDDLLTEVAKLSCYLQKKYPAINQIQGHQNVAKTQCPGSLENKIDQIKRYANKYGCDFK